MSGALDHGFSPQKAVVDPGKDFSEDFTNGDLKVGLGSDGRLIFTRVSDGQVLSCVSFLEEVQPASLTATRKKRGAPRRSV